MVKIISKYAAMTLSVATVAVCAGSIAAATASAQVSVSASTNVNVSAKAAMPAGMPGMSAADMAHMNKASSTHQSSTTREERLDQRQGLMIGNLSSRSNTEISDRISSLNMLLTRVNAMTKLSATQKTSITAEINTLISELTTLQAKILVDASSTQTGQRGDVSSSSALRADVQSITKAYRVFALVIPQTEILAAADRAETIVADFATISAKFQTRIAAAQSAGQNVASLRALLADLTAKTSDAQVQATAAVTATANLTPDNGNATVAASNEAALKTGRTAIQTAASDIKAATADAQKIVKALEANATVAASATVN